MSGLAVGQSIGAGKEAEVFACGAHVLKLYKDPAPKASAFRESAIMAIVDEGLRGSP